MYCDSDIILYNSICMFTHQETKECTFCACHVVENNLAANMY